MPQEHFRVSGQYCFWHIFVEPNTKTIFYIIRELTQKCPIGDKTPLFRQPLTNGSGAGLVTLTAYKATKIGIEECLIEKFQKVH